MIDRSPFCASFGVWVAAREPSPRNRGPSSDLLSCAASLIVNGRTRTATEIDEAPPMSVAAAMVEAPSRLFQGLSTLVHEREDEQKVVFEDMNFHWIFREDFLIFSEAEPFSALGLVFRHCVDEVIRDSLSGQRLRGRYLSPSIIF